ncbi:hypothetical protein GCM10025857_12020 [Alicyclobacillus contaminans]|uniref:hypothetical protein n=1 Tax=Alicyclobacillus contaminans TaxID=392016 RepID=UPI0004059A5F|nr:hypothetical protein [Alicyclobacillus contaminans]GMA49845.1 hypothetical protein GCM10025857_12020 [Alicyclobacillus contaminans]
MPSLIVLGMVNQNSPQQNAGLFLGEGNIGGWDSNYKLNQGHGSTFGVGNVAPAWLSVNVDNLEVFDGVMNDQDLKVTMAVDV